MCGSACTGEGRYAPARGERGTRVFGRSVHACMCGARARARKSASAGGEVGAPVRRFAQECR